MKTHITLIALALLLLIPAVAAETPPTEPQKDIPILQTLLGFETPAGGFWEHAIIGWLAGIWLFLISMFGRFQEWWRFISKRIKIKPETHEIYGNENWIRTISGRIWKVLLIGIVYGTIIYIPVLNRIVQTITLDLFLEGLILRSAILALELGILPGVIEKILLARTHAKLNKEVTKTAKLNAKAQD
tara:strand:- start:106 stop:666 length:561 start_codon:yes stop_codon:yes gene_type:complete